MSRKLEYGDIKHQNIKCNSSTKLEYIENIIRHSPIPVADRLLGLRVRIPQESCRLCRVTVYDLETSRMRRPWPALGCCAREKKSHSFIHSFIVDQMFEWRSVFMLLTYTLVFEGRSSVFTSVQVIRRLVFRRVHDLAGGSIYSALLYFANYCVILLLPSSLAQQPNAGPGHLILEVSISHTMTHHNM
jgi:hypothetical protein